MKPTNKLRFVERLNHTGEYFEQEYTLQQWWEEDGGDYDGLGEWRDVPMEKKK